MKIAYVTLHWSRTANSGIGMKMARQMDFWQSEGHSVTCYMHTHEVQNLRNLVPGEYFFYRSAPNILTIPFRETSRMMALKKLIKKVISDKPDVIYLRWGMYSIPLKILFQQIPVIVEINTNDLLEHRLLGFLLNLYNKLTRSIVLSRAAGLVFTSNELAVDSTFSLFTKQRVVISNGIDLDAHPTLPAPKTATPHLVFIGTPDLPWQGVEKLVKLAQIFPDISIDIVGCKTIPGTTIVPRNLKLHGYLVKKDYEKILANATAAIGTLSLYEKGMQEASPLKVRECAAYGIPLILPYKDTDLHGQKCDAILELPNTEDNITENAQRIHDFLYRMQERRLERKIIYPLLDIKQKELARLNFFRSFIK